MDSSSSEISAFTDFSIDGVEDICNESINSSQACDNSSGSISYSTSFSRTSSIDKLFHKKDDLSSFQFSELDEINQHTENIQHEESSSEESIDNFHFDHLLPIVNVESNKVMKSTLFYYWQISSQVSDAALDRMLKMIHVLYPNCDLPLSIKCMKSDVKHLFLENPSQPIDITTQSGNKILTLDFKYQIQLLISQYHEIICSYSHYLKANSNTDILNSKCMENIDWKCNKCHLDLFFIASCDGGSFCNTTNFAIWPFQMQLLNLPPILRQKSENLLLLGLISHNGKPNLQECLPELIKHIPNEFSLNGITIKVCVKLFVCDLPALAAIFNVKQFNGRYSCPKCLHPGRISEDSKVWIFPQFRNIIIPQRSHMKHLQHAECNDLGNPVFGVKGHSSLEYLLRFPEDNPIDSMHCLFEGQTKFILESFTNRKLKHLPCCLSERQVKNILEIMQTLRVPSEYMFSNSIKQLSLWKAKELRFFSFHLLLPLILPFSSNNDLKLVLCSIVAIYHLLYSIHSDTNLMHKLSEFFLLNASAIFSESVLRLNFHLLIHLSDGYEKYGPIYSTSMFAFEASMKLFKSFIHGSRNEINQIATKFIQFKVLSHAINSNKEVAIKSAFQTIKIGNSCEYLSEVINENRAIWEGKNLHSYDYDLGLKSSCSYILLKSGAYACIKRFSHPDKAHITIYTCETKNLLAKFIQCSSSTQKELFKLLSNVLECNKTFKFDLLKLSEKTQESTVSLSDISHRCIVVNLLTGNLHSIVPLVEVPEHS